MWPRPLLVRALVALLPLVLLATSWRPSAARACMPGVVHPEMAAFVFWHDGVQVTVWRSLVSRGPSFPGGAPRPGPATRAKPFAWVLAVPSAPIAYAVAESRDFDNAERWAEGYVDRSALTEGIGGARGAHDGAGRIEVGATTRVGDYEVTPVAGTGPASVSALRQWLRRHGFRPPASAALRFYAARNATFLAVKAALPAGHQVGDLRPLAIAFRSDVITLPVHMAMGEAPFALTATILASRRPLLGAALGHGLSPLDLIGPAPSRAQDQDGVIVVPDINLASATRNLIRPVLRGLPQLARLEGGTLYFARVAATPLRIAPAQEDPSIPLGEPIDAGATLGTNRAPGR